MSATSQAGNNGLPEIVTSTVAPKTSRQRWISAFTTTDHKRIGRLFIGTAFGFFMVGGTEAILLRLQLGVANNSLITPDHYNQLFTMHGTTMMFLFLTPMIIGLANYILPLQLGARRTAFPRIGALAYWLFLAGGIALYSTLLFTPPEAGWTSYPPLSSAEFSPSAGQDHWIYLFLLTGLSALLSSINFIATLITMRAPGMTWSRVPVFAWTILTYAGLTIIALPVAAAAATMLLFDRNFGTSFFDPTAGGSPLLWQDLFWFFGQPQSYMALLPALGIVTEIFAVFSGKASTTQKAITRSVLLIAGLSLFTWGSRMFTTGGSNGLNAIFMITTLLVFIPTASIVFSWLSMLNKSAIVTSSPFLYAAGFVSVFVFGTLTGLFLAIFPVDWQLADTAFVVAQFHYTVAAGGIFGLLAALHYWYPKLSGRLVSESLAKASFWLIFAGFNITFLVQYSLGLDGMPRRIYEYSTTSGWGTESLISTVGSVLLGIGILIAAVNFIRSYTNGALAGPDPWTGNTLEWFTPSPPPEHNFDVVPTVHSVEPMRDIRAEIARSSTGV